MSNVISLSERRQRKETKTNDLVPQDIRGPIDAIITWAESNGIDVENNVKFHFRLADFVSLLQTEIPREEARSA